MPEAVIVAAARTPIGRARKGSLASLRPDDLGGLVVDHVVRGIEGLDPATIEDVVIGCAVPEGQQGFGVGRTVSLLAGLPNTVPGLTVSRACASSLQAIRSAAHAVVAGEGHVFVAGGVESVSQVPVPIGYDDLNPRFTDRSRGDFVAELYLSMLETAENVARRHDVSRARMDEFAALSQQRAVAAQQSGFFDREIVPVPRPDGTVVTRDDGPRADTTVASLAALSPVVPDGRVTAGNACPLNDGAAAVIVMSDVRARELGLTPLARIVASAVSGVEPEYMGVGPIEAVRKVLARAGMEIGDIDVVELNEAFAAQVLAVTDALGIDVAEQLNPFGGAIALGHPFGMTGARIMTTLLNGLRTRDQQFGIETMCIGGGMGMAMLVECLS